MIYANFFYFIVVLSLLSVADGVTEYSAGEVILNLLISVFIYSTLVYIYFETLDKRYTRNQISYKVFARSYSSGLNLWVGAGVLFFGVELFIFDLKHLFKTFETMPGSDFIINCLGLMIFLIHPVVTWFLAFITAGKRLKRADSSGKYVWGHIKFNLVILIPWIILSVVIETVTAVGGKQVLEFGGSLFFQVAFFVTFLGIFALFAPILMVRFWDCKPLNDPGLKYLIDGFSERTGIKFRRVLSWNALNGSLITAGVIGLMRRFRYLLITPELMRTLDTAEILGVVGHEAGHVKKKHILFYIFFFGGFIIINIGLLDWLVIGTVYFLESISSFNFLTDNLDGSSLNFITVIASLVIFFIYFRFLFGYFMRNFERQADCFCYEAGIPLNFLISAFQKLRVVTGDDGTRRNWHHYNILERINFLKEVEEDPETVIRHNRKVRKRLIQYSIGLVLVGTLALNPYTRERKIRTNLEMYASAVEQKVTQNPENYLYYSVLGMVYYSMEQWGKVKTNFEQSLMLNSNQPETLNNYSWFLLKCPVDAYLDPLKALELSRRALSLRKAPHIYDTFAEAALQNELYKEALWASGKALEMKSGDEYFESQYQKIKRKAILHREKMDL